VINQLQQRGKAGNVGKGEFETAGEVEIEKEAT
jgi:hypothetical protein